MEMEIRPLMNLLCTLQVINDQIDNLPARLDKTVYKRELKQATKLYAAATRSYIKALSEPNQVLVQIWENVPIDDMDNFLVAWRRILYRLQYSTFETLNELNATLEDAERKPKILEQFELVLNTHVVNEPMRVMYREKLGYTKEQYELLMEMIKSEK